MEGVQREVQCRKKWQKPHLRKYLKYLEKNSVKPELILTVFTPSNKDLLISEIRCI